MASTYLKQYEATVHYTSTGSSHTKMYSFTEAQAMEVGAIMEKDGMPLWAAEKLVKKWNAFGRQSDIRYSYRLP